MRIEKEEARAIANELRAFDIIDENDTLISSPENYEINRARLLEQLNKFKKKTNRNDVAEFMTNLCNSFFEIDLNMFGTVFKSVADKMTEKILLIIESELISRWSTLGVNSLTNALSTRIQHYCLVDDKQNTDSQNADKAKYEELVEKKRNNQTLTDDETTFIKSFGSFRYL